MALLVQRGEGAMEYGDTLGTGVRVANAVRSVGVYLLQTVWPVRLAAWYPHPEAVPAGEVALSAAAAVGLSLVALACWRRVPAVAVR